MLYFIFTVDGDWDEYFQTKLLEESRAPKKDVLQNLIQQEIDLAEKVLNGRFIHFIHTSSRARDFFLQKEFLLLWKRLVRNGGDVGLHCHEDDPYKEYYYEDISRMKKVISERTGVFRKAGLEIKCYRSGFLGFSSKMARILEENEIFFDFSCEPGRFLKHGKSLVCDWRESSETHYRMDYNNHTKPGNSKVLEIPLGASKGKYLYFEKFNLKDIEEVAGVLKEKSIKDKCDIIVSTISHTYDYESSEVIKDIEEKVSLLKKYGKFINIAEAERIIT